MLTKRTKLRKIIMAFLLVAFANACSFTTLSGGDVNQASTSVPSQMPTNEMYTSLLQYDCLEVARTKSFPEVKGNIATYSEEMDNRISLWNLNKEQETNLGRVEILNGAFSTHQKIAYIDADRHAVIIVSAQGEELTSIPAPKNWIEILGWANEEHLLISNMPFRDDGGWRPPSSTIILNIASGKHKEIFPEYPNIYPYTSGPPNFGRYSYSIAAYDPTLTRVIYPGVTQTDFFIVLWDLVSNHEIIQQQLPASYYPPQWNSDGSFFIISLPPECIDWEGNVSSNVLELTSYIGGNELFSIGKAGEIKRLTYLTTRYIAEESSYTLSPTEKFVAFWLKNESDNYGWQLAVLDMETGGVTAYCLGGEDGSLPIIWSPDESHIVSTIINAETKNFEQILVNINKNIAYVIQNDEIAIGWMDK